MNRFIPLILVVGLLGVIVYAMNNNTPSSLSRLENTPVPPFQMETLSITAVQVDESVFKDKLTLLNVWASWCGVCQSEHPFLMSLAENNIIDLVGLNYRDNLADARNILRRTGSPYQTVIYDPRGKLSLDLGVYGTPESYLVDQHGMIRFRYSGALDTKIWQQEFEPVIQYIKEQQNDEING
ncbi:DsbE family thiol:disulfide interchange protein [Photobacterium minamisatsumaniensis]|uniref:DsbE family thiol:disulfide interchange protein n=1 Tax=Photobacterium minamisatsumaniensis TaxID=2910233 RepID=UPI003D0C1CA8